MALVLSAALFALVPRRTNWWTHFGQYTMYIYLLHSFVLYPFRETGVLRHLDPTWLWLPIVIVGSVLIAFGLATTTGALGLPSARRTASGVAVRGSEAGQTRRTPQRPDRLPSPAGTAACGAAFTPTCVKRLRRRPSPPPGEGDGYYEKRPAPTYEPGAAPGGMAHSPDRTWRMYSRITSVDSDRCTRMNWSGSR